MITGHGIHFDVIFEAQLYRKYLISSRVTFIIDVL